MLKVRTKTSHYRLLYVSNFFKYQFSINKFKCKIMAHLPCDKCGKSTNTQGSWDTPIKILCEKCSDKITKKDCKHLQNGFCENNEHCRYKNHISDSNNYKCSLFL